MPLGAAFFYFVMAMLFFMLGFWSATDLQAVRRPAADHHLVGVGVVLLLGRLGDRTRWEMWGDVWTWFVVQGPLGLSLWGLVLTLVLGGISFLTLRRAVP